MAARKAKKKEAKSTNKQPPTPINESPNDDDATEEESIHDDVDMEDADDIPDIIDQDGADDKTESKSKNDESKKSKNTSNEPIPFMDTFYQLSSEETKARSLAARDLISHCFFSSQGVNIPDAAYALTRLMNGLCTGRAASRQGFASALSTFLRLSHSSEGTLSSILEADSFGKDLIRENQDAASIFRLKLLNATQFQQTEKEAKKSGGKMKGMEERDHAFGRLFGILAVVRSGVLGLEDFPISVTEGYANDLIELYNYKNWLREPAANAIIELLSTLDAAKVVKVTNGVIAPKFFSNDGDDRERCMKDLNAEQIAVALHLQKLQNKLDKFTFPLNEPIMTAANVALFAQALSSTSSVVYPRCHIVWNVLWSCLTDENNGHRLLRKVKGSQAESVAIVENIVTEVVVKSLLGKGETSGSPSNERKSLALQVVSTLMGASNLNIVLPVELISTALCPDILESVFLNVLCASGGIGMKRSKATDGGNDGNVQHHLKSLTATTLSDIVARCSDVDFIERRMAMVKALMSVDPRFDVRTKTTTVGTLLMMEHSANELTDEQEHRQKELWDRYLSYLEEAIITADTLHKANVYVEQMFKLAKRDLTSAPANEARRVVRFFMTAAFFDCSNVSSPSGNKQTPSTKKKKGKKTSTKDEAVQPELSSAIRIKDILCSHKVKHIPNPTRTIMSSRFYSLMSDFISTVNSSRGNKTKSFYGNASKPESVYRALSEISGIISVLEMSGAMRYVNEPSGNSSDNESPAELSRKYVLEVKKIADEALVKECDGSDESEVLRANSIFTTGCASLIIALYLQLNSVDTDGEEDEEDQEEDKDAIHEFIADLKEIVLDFSGVIQNTTSNKSDDEENPLAAMASLLVNILSSSGGEDSTQNSASMASASKLTRETAKLAWSGVLSLMSSLHTNNSKNFVDEDVMSTLIESVCGSVSIRSDAVDDESMDESEDDNDNEVFAQAADMDLDLDEQQEADDSDEKQSNTSEGSDDEDVELDPSRLENMLLEDSDAEIDEDVLEHHEGADKALAKLIKMKQDTRKASQSERERIELCNRLRCAGLLEPLFSVSVFKSGWLPLEAVLGSFVPILRSYKSIAKSIEKSASSTVMSKSLNEKKALLDKLSSLIHDKLSKYRCSDKLDAESLLKAVTDIADEMKQSLNLAHCSMCSIALITMVRCLPDAESNSEVSAVYSAAMEDWMSRKSTKIHTCVFDDVIQRLPSLAATVLIGPLIKSAKDAHTGYLKCESLRLLSLFYRGDRSNKDDTVTPKAHSLLNDNCSNVAVVLKDSLCDPILQKTKNKDELLNAVKHFVTYARSRASSISAADLNELKDALKTAADTTKSAGMKNTCSRLAEELSEVAKEAAGPKPPKSSSKKKKSKK